MVLQALTCTLLDLPWLRVFCLGLGGMILRPKQRGFGLLAKKGSVASPVGRQKHLRMLDLPVVSSMRGIARVQKISFACSLRHRGACEGTGEDAP